MAAITQLSADFEGTDGAAVPNGAAIGATQITGSGTVTYSGTAPKQGSTDVLVSATATTEILRWDLTTPVTTFWDVVYVKIPAAPSASTTFLSVLASDLTTTVAALRINTDMTVTLRDAATGVWTSPSATPAPTNAWFRLGFKAIPGSTTGLRCRIYTGSAGDTVTPDMDSGNQTCTNAGAANVGQLRLGIVSNSTMAIHFDRNRADNATEPAGLTTGLPPTVSAGPDLTKETGSGTFTITATVTPSSGTTIVSRSWSILSGNTVTLSGQTTDTVTVTAPTSTTGSTVLRYTATASDGQSSTDDVTLTWVAAGQTLYPTADVSNAGAWTTQTGGTTSLFATIDEPVLDTSDYIATPQLTATPAPFRFRLQPKPAPTNTTGWFLRINKRDLSDVTTTSLVAKLYESDGTTLRKTWSAITTVNASDTEYQLTLTSGEVAAITSWASGLIVELSATGS